MVKLSTRTRVIFIPQSRRLTFALSGRRRRSALERVVRRPWMPQISLQYVHCEQPATDSGNELDNRRSLPKHIDRNEQARNEGGPRHNNAMRRGGKHGQGYDEDRGETCAEGGDRVTRVRKPGRDTHT